MFGDILAFAVTRTVRCAWRSEDGFWDRRLRKVEHSGDGGDEDDTGGGGDEKRRPSGWREMTRR